MNSSVPSTTMGKFGVSYDINAINNIALKAGIKPLTPAQFKSMSPKQVNNYLKAAEKALRMNRTNVRRIGKTMRKNAKLTTSENYKQAQLMHTTIRQGLAELGALGSQGIAQLAFSKPNSSGNVIQQNTSGGVTPTGNGDSTSKGPVYAYRERDEE